LSPLLSGRTPDRAGAAAFNAAAAAIATTPPPSLSPRPSPTAAPTAQSQPLLSPSRLRRRCRSCRVKHVQQPACKILKGHLAYGLAILARPSFNLILIKGRPGNQNRLFRLNLSAKPAGFGAGSAGFNILNF